MYIILHFWPLNPTHWTSKNNALRQAQLYKLRKCTFVQFPIFQGRWRVLLVSKKESCDCWHIWIFFRTNNNKVSNINCTKKIISLFWLSIISLSNDSEYCKVLTLKEQSHFQGNCRQVNSSWRNELIREDWQATSESRQWGKPDWGRHPLIVTWIRISGNKTNRSQRQDNLTYWQRIAGEIAFKIKG